ncbi:MAG TPA: TonB-dependent receptor [Cyclobacteriaceae bacterium]
MKYAFALLLLFAAQLAFSQTQITGKVTDQDNSPVPLANVFLEGTYDGAMSTDDGSFSFETSEEGTHTLVVRMVGYREFRKEVMLSGKPVAVEVRLAEEISQLNAVTISASAFTASDESRRTVFRALDIATTAGATADIAGALNTLPGTQKVGESGRLFVRGGDGDEAKTFIDGMLLLDAYSPSAPNTPSRGRFLPFMFKGTSFSTGAYSAEFGQALSSVLALDSKDETELTRTDIGLMSVGGDITHTQAWDGGSAAAKIQYTNLRPYVGWVDQEIDWHEAPASISGIGSFRQHLTKSGLLKVYATFNNSDFALFDHDIDDPSQSWLLDRSNDYAYVNASYKDILSEKWIIRGGVAYSDLNDGYEIDGDAIRENERGAHIKTVIEGSVHDQIELKTGVEVLTRKYNYDFTPADGERYSSPFDENIVAAFAETDLYASNNFVTRVGMRMEHNSLTNEVTLDPRVSLAHKAGKNGQVSLAWGRFRQTPKNEWLRQQINLDPERAQHFVLSYQRIEDNKTLRIEAYHKQYDDLVKIRDGVITSDGSGYARGFEFFWRDNNSIKNLDYWISYSYLDTERDYIDFPIKATPTFASKHNFSVVGKYFVPKLKSQLGATWSFTSGRPYNNPNKPIFNSGRTPSYQDLSFNWSYLPKPYLIIYFSCTNVLGRDNIFGYEYSSSLNEAGMYNSRAIRQPAPRFVFLGIFYTISKDKTVNQLPTL